MKKVQILQSRLLRALLFNFIAVIIFNCIFHPYFETNDDNLMALISDGAMAGYSSHLIFINILYGQLLVILHTICPGINWYSGLLFLILFLSFTAVTYVWMKLKPGKIGYLISIVFLFWFGYYSYVVLQFTRVAGIAAAAGTLLMFYGLDKERGKRRVLVWGAGAFLALIGCTLRFEMFVLCSAFLAGLGFWRGIAFFRSGGLKGIRKMQSYLLPYILVLLLGIGLKAIDTLAYSSQQEWKEYKEFNALRSELMDYGFPSYGENQAIYKSMGISEEDLGYYATWNFADPEKFSKENLKILVSLKEKREINLQFFIDFVWEMARRLFYEKSFIFFGLFFLLYCAEWKKNIFPLAFTGIGVLFIQLYFYYQGRFLLERVDMPIWFCACVILAYTGQSTILKKCAQTSRYWIVASLVFVLNGDVMASNITTCPDHETQETQKEILENISADKETLYCTNVSSLEQAYDIRHRMEKNSMSNVYFLGSWLYGSPITERIKTQYGVSNPFRECIDDPNLLIVDTYNAEATEAYIQRNYDEDAQMVKIKAVQGQNIYQVISEDFAVEPKEEKTLDDSIVYNLWGSRISDGEVQFQGYLYQKDKDSFQQRFYIRITDTRSGTVTYHLGMQTDNDESSEARNGKYAGLDQKITLPAADQGFLRAEVILETEDGVWYAVPVENIQ